MSPRLIIEAFLDAWNENDVDRIHSFMSEDIAYHNIPMEPIHGRSAARAFAEAFGVGTTMKAEWELVHIAEQGDIVMTERIDSFIDPNGNRVTVPIMGVFRIRDGLISEWRDYFDLATFERQLATIKSAEPRAAGNAR
ncbi:limonene-1,2-epoxide hydrolase family protein [Mesorhizobium kowhaii]|uniref:Limonene-1,2-epoxide hydrolase domain-containing protein n=1 Tax=Mesorhizobium kowhaii TaxID=1300272 RepID=A0A2W7E6G5_9HYPH|nr:limonene-1,2-epoxide hydrolase family protein [Mesorhizobium kowhaii]PZV38796.1 hypothetical protein B5V02_09075 [Mesorhizobium kowhaii]